MSPDIPLKIAEDQTLEGNGPVVFLGPNGAGKTRHAVKVTEWNSADLVPALRNIALPPDVPMQSLPQASQELKQNLDRRRSRPWELANEINQLFAKLMAEDSAAAIRFRDDHVAGQAREPDQTKLMRLRDIWIWLFAGRYIDFSGHRPVVRSDYSSAAGEYTAQQMSDGERVALYLAGRVLDSEQPIVIVDEPEVHFHSRLGTRFWNAMETLRTDCRFLYVTHDLPFALSRRDATFVVIMPDEPPKIVQLERGMPKELAESLLAAASFSIFARRIIFCEGIEGPSLDQALYTAWFNSPDTAVIPVETSTNVITCAATFGESDLVTGIVAEGLVDRDYWSESYLNDLPRTVRSLEVHEVENLFCLPGVFLSVARHLGISSNDADSAYKSFLENIKGQFTGDLLSKQVTERVKRRCEHEFWKALNSTRLVSEATSFARSLDPSGWETSIEAIVGEEKQRLDDALQGAHAEINRYFPGKVFIKQAGKALGMSSERYCEIVCTALAAPTEELSELSRGLEDALRDYLPSRIFEPDA